MEMEEIYKCCNFIYERLDKEIDLINISEYLSPIITTDKYNEFLFFQFKKIILKEKDPILQEEYLFIIARILSIFKSLKEFQKVQFSLDTKDEINYIKFYSEIFNIINYITGIFPVDECKYVLQTIYPRFVTYKKLQLLLPFGINNENSVYNNMNKKNDILSKEIMELFRCFLLFIFLRSFAYIYYNINEFIQVFLGGEFRHDKYIGLIAQKKIDLLYDLVHRPNLKKIFDNEWYEIEVKEKDIFKKKNYNTMKDILNFGLFLKEINENFIVFNESYNIKYCLLYFFLLFNYEDYNFLSTNENKNNYQAFLTFFLKEVLVDELFEEENQKKLNQMISYKLLNFIHGKNYCTFYPTIYFEKFLVDVLAKKTKVDKDMNYPKNPWTYYANRLIKYNNISKIVESLSIDWPEKNQLIELIKEKIKSNYSHISS